MMIQNDLPENSAEPGFREVLVQRSKQGVVTETADFVACEVPVALVFNGISHAVMLATPLNLIDFALGFSFSEGIINQRADVYDIEEVVHPEVGIEVHLTIAAASFAQLKERRRTMVGRTGCGLCGLESLTAFEAGIATPALQDQRSFSISQSALFEAFNSLQQKQSINQITGAMHAAAWVDPEGRVLMVREDLGRHNALDKLIGALLDQKIPSSTGCVIMTSRASYELAQKTARAGIPLLATISAPTSLALDLARKSGLTLVGFVRNGGLVVYSCPDRIRF
ncbi:FdhD protein [Oxalobacteraceae bacterium GrIS 2.11]